MKDPALRALLEVVRRALQQIVKAIEAYLRPGQRYPAAPTEDSGIELATAALRHARDVIESYQLDLRARGLDGCCQGEIYRQALPAIDAALKQL